MYLIKRIVFSMSISSMLLAGLLIPLQTYADNTTGTANITGGTLTETVGTVPNVNGTINGRDQTFTTSIPVTVADTRGTGAGWNFTLSMTTFIAGGNTLPNTGTTVFTGGSSACSTGSTCTNASNGVTYPISVTQAASSPITYKAFNSAINHGEGSVLATINMSVFVPGNAIAGTYSSTVAVTIVSGP